MITEFDIKQSQLQALLQRHNLDGLLLQKVSSFAWATCGAASYVNTATTNGAGSLLVLRGGRATWSPTASKPRALSRKRAWRRRAGSLPSAPGTPRPVTWNG